MSWNVNGNQCASVYAKVDVAISDAATAHKGVSSSIDTAAATCSDAKFSKVETALNGLYNRCLTRQLTNVDTHMQKAVRSGRNVVTELNNGQVAMADSIAQSSRQVDWHAQILSSDKKKV